MYEQVLLEGAAYLNRNGYKYLCKSVCQSNKATFERLSDGWTLIAHGVHFYEDGTIDWDYSTGGYFAK